MSLFLLLYGCEQNELKTHSYEEQRELYETYCALCHGVNGEGYVAPQANALSNQDFLDAATDAFILDGIIDGRPGTKMSPWGEEHGGPLTFEEAQAITEYIRNWHEGTQADIHNMTFDGVSSEGIEIYQIYCSGCHGESGEGASAMSINHPEFLSEASDGFLWHAISVGRENTPMGSYADVLSEEDIANLIALIRSWE